MKRLDPGNRRPHLQPIYAPYQTAEYLAWLAESRPLASEQLSGQLLSHPTRLLGPQDEENCANGPSPQATWPFWTVNTEQGTDGEGLLNLERLCPSFTLDCCWCKEPSAINDWHADLRTNTADAKGGFLYPQVARGYLSYQEPGRRFLPPRMSGTMKLPKTKFSFRTDVRTCIFCNDY